MKRVVILLIILLVIALLGYLGWLYKPSPPIETKFVQEIREVVKEVEVDINEPLVDIKEPEVSALLPSPNHTYQNFNNCGPATLSMALSYFGQNVTQKELADKMRPYQVASGDNDDKTIFTHEFVDWARTYSVNAVGRVNGDIEILKEFTSNGIFVVVKTWLHPNEDIGHFRIVRGYDDEKKVVIQDDSYDGPNKKISYYDFLSMWQPFNYAYIIVYSDEQSVLVDTLLGQEKDETVAWKNAQTRAEKEKNLDTENVYPPFNLSTSYYHLGEYQKSVKEFEEVEADLPKRMLWYQIEPILSYYELTEYDRVFAISEKILNNGNRAFSELYQLRGEIYLEKKEEEKARQEFEKAIQYNENYQPAKDALNALIN